MNDAAPSKKTDTTEDLITEIVSHLREHGDLAAWVGDAARHHSDRARPAALAQDLLHGADEIAEFIYGDRNQRRRVYRLVRTNALPHFRIGNGICIRKSVLLTWIERQTNLRSGTAWVTQRQSHAV